MFSLLLSQLALASAASDAVPYYTFGGATLAITYLDTAAVGTILLARDAASGPRAPQTEAERRRSQRYPVLYVPVVGPFVAIHTLEATGGDRRLLLASGALQTLGLGLIVTGGILAGTEQHKTQLAPTLQGLRFVHRF